MNVREALSALRKEDNKILRLGHVMSVLGWDQDTVMPPSASIERGEQFALLSSLMHEASTSKRMEEIISSLDGVELSGADKALYRYWKKEVTNQKKLPVKLVEDMAIAHNEAHSAWIEARANNSWKIFEPALERVVDLTKEQASRLGDGKDLYDTLLDLYEEGMSKEIIDPVFDDLKDTIHSLMDKLESVEVDDSFLYEKYDQKALHSFCMDLIDRMGFDHNRGVVGITEHPYTTALGVDDHRISTRYTDDGIFDPIGSIVHETGHVLYEMSATMNPEIRGTNLAQGVSMGVHESQSRFWENIMGRSRAFWTYQYPNLQKALPHLHDISLDLFLRAINKSHPSAIRVNADELTYNLHIMLRYQIEKMLFSGEISVSDIPNVWNGLSSSLIRYEIKSDLEGALQDVHWSQGSIGYFPTYSLGNIYSASFYNKMCEDLGGKDKVNHYLSSGDYSRITAWQCDNIWSKGMLLPPGELVESVTGAKVDASAFKEYLVTKFSDLYLR